MMEWIHENLLRKNITEQHPQIGRNMVVQYIYKTVHSFKICQEYEFNVEMISDNMRGLDQYGWIYHELELHESNAVLVLFSTNLNNYFTEKVESNINFNLYVMDNQLVSFKVVSVISAYG